MKAHYMQHVPYEGLGTIAPWLERHGARITGTRWYEPDAIIPPVEQVDLLIIMGGPMSVTEEDEYPWLVQEKTFVREMIAQGKPVLGICLGAQVIASAAGGAVYPNGEREVGWFPVAAVASGNADAFAFPAEFLPFHWHGETFDLPAGAVHLARSVACENQAFQLGERVIGLQFHPEVTPAVVAEFIDHNRDYLIDAPYVATEPTMLSAPPEYYRDMEELLERIMGWLVR